MKSGVSLLIAILVAATMVYVIRQNARDARNRAAIERAMYGTRAKPAASPAQDAAYRRRIEETAAARRRQMQQ